MKPVTSLVHMVYGKRVKQPCRPKVLFLDSVFLADDHLANNLGVVVLDVWP